MGQTAETKQQREERWPDDYWERIIVVPGTRRLDLAIRRGDETFHGRRLALVEVPGGDNFVDVVPATRDEYLRVRAAISSGAIATPWRRTRGGFGTWAYYRDTVTLLREVVEHLGWTLDDEETALLDSLAGYAPGSRARLRMRANGRPSPCIGSAFHTGPIQTTLTPAREASADTRR